MLPSIVGLFLKTDAKVRHCSDIYKSLFLNNYILLLSGSILLLCISCRQASLRTP